MFSNPYGPRGGLEGAWTSGTLAANWLTESEKSGSSCCRVGLRPGLGYTICSYGPHSLYSAFLLQVKYGIAEAAPEIERASGQSVMLVGIHLLFLRPERLEERRRTCTSI